MVTPLAALARPLLRRAEQALLASARPLSTPPVFVLGPPRSGMTLLYQALADCFEFAYLCNGANERSRYPAVTTLLLRRRIRGYRTDYTSTYGKTLGAAGPSEALDVWRRWFPTDRHYSDESRVSAEGAREMRQTIAAVAGILKAPFLNKDPHHSVRVRALNAIFPGCVFLYVQRDPVTTAESMLRIRIVRAESRVGDVTSWMSVKPREYDLLAGRPPVEQVSGQSYYCARNALDDLARVASGRFLTVAYEAFCRDPRSELDRIVAFLAGHGVSPRRTNPCPPRFSDPAGGAVPESDQASIRACLDRLQRGAVP